MDAAEQRRLFTAQNLKEITAFLIEAFKAGDEARIGRILRTVKGQAAGGDLSRGFAELIKLLHPDRLRYYQNILEAATEARALQLPPIDAVLRAVRFVGPVSPSSRRTGEGSRQPYEDVSFDEEAAYAEEDFDSSRDTEWADEDNPVEILTEEEPRSFAEAVKLKEYGSLEVHYTPGVLRSMEGSLDLSDFEIDDLRGAEYCQNVVSMNLSHNRIDDLSPLSLLQKLEELFISDNHVDSLTPLQNLHALRVLDISYNSIEDIAPLLGLANLEFVNLVGNAVPEQQKEELSARGVLLVG